MKKKTFSLNFSKGSSGLLQLVFHFSTVNWEKQFENHPLDMANRPPERLSEFQREWVCVRGGLSKKSGADDQDLVVEAELLDFLLSLEPVLVLDLKYWRLVTCFSGFVPGTDKS